MSVSNLAIEAALAFYFFGAAMYAGMTGLWIVEVVRKERTNSQAYLWVGVLAAIFGSLPLVMHVIDVDGINEIFPVGIAKWAGAALIFAVGLPTWFLHRRTFSHAS